jgi:hypothetical protein
MPRAKYNRPRILTLEREHQALAMRRQGMTYEAIGRALGINASSAWRAVERAYQRSLRLCDEDANFNRQLDLDRMDVALRALWPHIEAGKEGAIDRLLAIIDRRMRLLGLETRRRRTWDSQEIGDMLASYLARLEDDGDASSS